MLDIVDINWMKDLVVDIYLGLCLCCAKHKDPEKGIGDEEENKEDEKPKKQGG